MQIEADAAYAAAVLAGSVPTQGAWKDRWREPGGGRGVSSRQRGRHSAGRQSADPPYGHSHGQPRPQQQQQQQPASGQQQQQQQQRPSGQQQQAAAGEGAASPDSPAAGKWSLPGPRSSARVAHCTACDVWVPQRAGDWQVHTAGIRHRRQLLSLKVHGERNHLVLSAFESMPGSGEAAHRLVGKAAADFGLEPGRRRQQQEQNRQCAPPAALLEAAAGLRREAIKQLLNMFGVGQMYNSAAATFEERALATCLQHALQPLPHASSSGSCPVTSSSFSAGTGAELAAVAHLASTGRIDAAQLAILLSPQPAGAPRSQHAGLAAALPLLLPALSRVCSLVELRLELPVVAGADAARVAQLWQQAWQHTLPALRCLLEGSTATRSLRLVLPRCLQAATEAYAPQLAAAAAAAPAAVRSQVLLALHPRVGRCSLLQLLPLAVVREVLDLAAPLQPCELHLTWKP
ncbi:hypothetical protein D9Q98_002923 [Chlorella vulgaris]|uniref:Uncharacterized protein n=1 Tax=Chlorella vulgaris TaxID=3077 RepID=A0A9D4TU61_CHLVU|nr:hypothetical protein D9Q98_002923 [Chlorella vulgaris]